MYSVFLTGATGTVGHYLIDLLSPAYHLYLLVRNEQRLNSNVKNRENVTVINASLDELADQAELLKTVDYCVHAATAWGGADTERINVQRSHQLFDLLNPERIKRVIYFSTASIIDGQGRPLEAAAKFGTEYIQTKYQCYLKLPESRIADQIVTVFPTLIFGGDETHPTSHLSKALPLLKKYSWLLGRINMEIGFHYIHAYDIAAIVRYLLEAPEVAPNYVLGNEAVTVGEFTKRIAGYFGHKIRWQLKANPQFIYRLARLLGVRFTPWDRYCMEHPDFTYPVVNCRTFGIPTDYGTIEEILAAWERTGKAGSKETS